MTVEVSNNKAVIKLSSLKDTISLPIFMCFILNVMNTISAYYPIYSAANWGSQAPLYHNLDPMLVKYNVTAYFSGHDHVSQHLSSKLNSLDNNKQMTQYFVVGQGTDPYKHQDEYWGCVNCDVDFYWNYPNDCLGVFGVFQVFEDEFGLLKPKFQFIDARDNSVIYEQELYARFRPEDVPKPSPSDKIFFSIIILTISIFVSL